MGFIRSALFVIASVLLFLLFIVGNVFLTLNLSLDYDNVKPELVSVIQNLVGDEIDEAYFSMEATCQNNSEFVFSHEESGQVFVIPCEIVLQGSDEIINYSVNSFVEDSYYKNYDCDFFNCFEDTENSFFFVSEQAKNYWKSKFHFVLVISLFLIALMFFLIQGKKNLPIVAGVLLILASLPFMKINWVMSFFSNNQFLQFFTISFSKSFNVFLISLSVGIILILLGFVLKLFGIGFQISNFFNKFSKKEISEDKEIKKEFAKSKKGK
ncbi:MAG: hypothetical protein ABIG37_00940 [Nanoarchaeota archaeon]